MANTTIPQPLLGQLHALRPLLECNGIVQYRADPDRRPAYRLRFRDVRNADGVRRHRSIPIANADVAQAVCVLLDAWRGDHYRRLEEARRDRQARTQAARDVRHQRRDLVDLAGGGERRRRVVGRAFDEAQAAGPMATWTLFATARRIVAPGRPGRRRGSALSLLGISQPHRGAHA